MARPGARASTCAPPGAVQWAPQLETGGARPGPPSPAPAPEICALASTSQAGRVNWHRNQFVPPHCRSGPAAADAGQLPGEEEADHRLYLAIYRDKVRRAHALRDQEEAAAALPKSGSGRRAAPSDVAPSAGPASARGERQVVADAAAHAAAASARGPAASPRKRTALGGELALGLRVPRGRPAAAQAASVM
ncbi:unnamed protein product, partial [Prorocentrum cordatum]